MRFGRSHDLGTRLRTCWLKHCGPSFEIRPGASAEDFAEFERVHRVTLPSAVRGYLAVVNGMREDDSDDQLTSFWGLDRMRPIAQVYNCTSPHPRSQDDYVLCDLMINALWYAIRLGPPGPGAGQVFMWGVRDFPVAVATSFSSFAEAYLADRSSLPDAAIEEPALCPVHHVPMSRRQIGHRYGPFPYADVGVYEAAVRDFPYSGDGHWGGDKAPKKPATWIEPVCDCCATARKEWIALHPPAP